MTDVSLAPKLRIQAGRRALVLRAPADLAIVVPSGAEVFASGRGPFDVVLLFAKNAAALAKDAPRALGALAPGAAFWVAYPKTTSGVTTDLTRDRGWDALTARGLRPVSQIAVDEVWSALRFKPSQAVKVAAPRARSSAPADLVAALRGVPAAKKAWAALPPSHAGEYLQWIEEAKRPETRARRVAEAIARLTVGRKRAGSSRS